MMKNTKAVLIGILSLLFYYFVSHLMFLSQYNENYATIQNAMFFVLPALPGIALAILLIRNSLREFLKAWGISILSSVCLFFIWNSLRIDLLNTSLTGFEEFSLGEGLLVVVMSLSYIMSCTVGCIIAGAISFYIQKKTGN